MNVQFNCVMNNVQCVIFFEVWRGFFVEEVYGNFNCNDLVFFDVEQIYVLWFVVDWVYLDGLWNYQLFFVVMDQCCC